MNGQKKCLEKRCQGKISISYAGSCCGTTVEHSTHHHEAVGLNPTGERIYRFFPLLQILVILGLRGHCPRFKFFFS